MENDDFPALFREADNASNKKQRHFLFAVRTEIAALIVAAVVGAAPFLAFRVGWLSALLLLIAAAALVFRVQMRPERDWYQARALAESVKTLTWRFMARAEPFDGSGREAPNHFLQELIALLQANRSLGKSFDSTDIAIKQITEKMMEIRSLNLNDRKNFYLSNRVNDQLNWYSQKAHWNKTKTKVWMGVALTVYAIAILIVFVRPEADALPAWPIQPLIVAGMGVVGWMQIKKFSELAAAYSLAAQEISMARHEVEMADSEQAISEAVNSIERAFSREHVQWVARQEEV